MLQKLRYALGGLAVAAACYDTMTINTLSCYENKQLKHKKILTLLKLPFTEPEEGSLVLTMDNKKHIFKIVDTKSGKYSHYDKRGMSMYVPPGFVLLIDPFTGNKTLQCNGSIVGQYNFDVSWLFFWMKKQNSMS